MISTSKKEGIGILAEDDSKALHLLQRMDDKSSSRVMRNKENSKLILTTDLRIEILDREKIQYG